METRTRRKKREPILIIYNVYLALKFNVSFIEHNSLSKTRQAFN
jgi:hypothetical protein